jgi:F-type H+-transporting ATPase subunit b
MDLFRIDPGLTIWTWLTFGCLVFIVAQWVIPPLLRNLEAREHAIAQAVDDAAALEQRLKAIEEERTAILTEARTRGEALIQRARQRAQETRKSLLKHASEEAQAVIAQGRVQVAEERRAAVEALRDELAEFALSCAGSIVSSVLVGDNERRWAREQARRL